MPPANQSTGQSGHGVTVTFANVLLLFVSNPFGFESTPSPGDTFGQCVFQRPTRFLGFLGDSFDHRGGDYRLVGFSGL